MATSEGFLSLASSEPGLSVVECGWSEVQNYGRLSIHAKHMHWACDDDDGQNML